MLHLIEEQPILTDAIQSLLVTKRAAPEMGLSEPISCIHDFIEQELARLEKMNPQRTFREAVLPQLNALFYGVLHELPLHGNSLRNRDGAVQAVR